MAVPNHRTIVNGVDRDYPGLLRTNTKESAGTFTRLAAARLYKVDPNWGLLTKGPGENQWQGYAVDVVIHRAENTVVDIITDAGSGKTTVPGWLVHDPGTRPTNHWAPPVMIADPQAGDEPPPTPPPSTPPPMDAELKSLLKQLIASQDAATAAITALLTRLNEPLRVIPGQDSQGNVIALQVTGKVRLSGFG